MEPFKIQVEVSLSEKSLAAITTLLDRARAVTPESRPQEAVVPIIRPITAPPRPEPAEAPKPTADGSQEDDAAEDLPIADEELLTATRAAVARVKKVGGSPSLIREQIFSKYGIASSTQCPQEHRAALLKDLQDFNI